MRRFTASNIGLMPKKAVSRFAALVEGIPVPPPFSKHSKPLRPDFILEPITRSEQAIARIPAHAYFLVSAVFHYLGPAFAVLLFRHVDSLGVASMRIATAAVVFAAWRRPWRFLRAASAPQRALLCGLGVVLGSMNVVFYLAIERLPLATVGADRVSRADRAGGARRTLGAQCRGARRRGARRVAADRRAFGSPSRSGSPYAFANCALFMLYIVLGHRIAADGGASGIDRLGRGDADRPRRRQSGRPAAGAAGVHERRIAGARARQWGSARR